MSNLWDRCVTCGCWEDCHVGYGGYDLTCTRCTCLEFVKPSATKRFGAETKDVSA
jgi:hypothetical protein